MVDLVMMVYLVYLVDGAQVVTLDMMVYPDQLDRRDRRVTLEVRREREGCQDTQGIRDNQVDLVPLAHRDWMVCLVE